MPINSCALIMLGLDDQGLGRRRKGRLLTRKFHELLGMGTHCEDACFQC